MTTAPGPAAWLDQATTHLKSRRWDLLVRLCEDPALPADAAAAAGLLGATAAAYLGQERRVPPHVSRALDAGAERLVLMQGLLAAAHAHVGAALGAAGEAASPDAAFHAEREALALKRLGTGLHQRPAKRAGGASDNAEILRQRQLVENLRQQLQSLRASAAASASIGIDPRAHALITAVRDSRLTYLSAAKLASLARTCLAIEEQHVPGLFVEAGCALGGSAVVIGSLKQPQRRFEIYDVFGMIPAPGEQDPPEVHRRYEEITSGSASGIGGDRYYGYETDLQRIVQRNLEHHGLDLATHHIALVRGLVQDTLGGDEAVAFAHMDVDWYEPSLVCLERLYPRLSVGGSIIVDDYHDWGGCRRAVDEYLARLGGGYVADDAARSLKITKLAPVAAAAK